MAVESINSSSLGANLDAFAPNSADKNIHSTSSGKISPEAESKIVDTFMAGMITNQLQLNSQLFDFAKEAINEADSE